MAFIRCELYSFYNVLFSVLTPIHVYDIHSGRWFLAVCLAPCQFIVSDKWWCKESCPLNLKKQFEC